MELTNEFRVSVPVEDAWAVLTDVERIAPCLPGAQLQEIEGDEYRGIVKVKVGPITAQYKGKATFQSRDDDAHVAVLKAEGRDTRGQGNASAIITATLTSEGGGTSVKVVTDLTITGKVAQFGRGVLVDVSGKLLTQFVECLENDLLSGQPSASAAPAPAAASANGAPVATAASGAPASSRPPSGKPTGPQGPPAQSEAEDTASGAPASSRPPSGKPSSPEGPPAQSEAKGTAQSEADNPVRKIEHQAAAPVDLLDAAGVPVAKRAIPVVAGVLVIVWFLRRRRRKR